MITCYQVLDAVQRWARGYFMIRETGIPFDDGGRIDALLVPISGEATCMKWAKNINNSRGYVSEKDLKKFRTSETWIQPR